MPHTTPWQALNWPNRISLVRLFLVAPFILLVVNQQDPQYPWARHAALGVFLVMGISDAIDGLLARRYNLRTRLGAILDPLADKILITCSVIILSLEYSSVPGMRLPSWVVLAVVGKDVYVVLGFIVLYLVTDRFRIQPTMAGKASTAGQVLMVVTVMLSPDINQVAPGYGTMLAKTCIWAVVVLVGLAAISYTLLGVAFVSEGQKPMDDHPKQRVISNKGSEVQ